MEKILYLTDLYYPAIGRNYYEEDLYITSFLKNYFQIAICHPMQVLSFLDAANLIIIRNTGPVIYYKEYFQKFIKNVRKKNIKTYNSIDGKADMLGKKYLLDLTKGNYPVIPTICDLNEIDLLGDAEKYVVKLEDGADSIGMEIVDKGNLGNQEVSKRIIQPYIDFIYEVSFYYIDGTFQYALYAPDKNKRWKLKEYLPDTSDLDFASKFIQWNDMSCGIQRVDACRTKRGNLLLVELEDLNPFLSIDLLNEEKKKLFVHNFIDSISKIMKSDK